MTGLASRLRRYALVAIAAASWGLWPLMLRRAESYGALDPWLESAVFMTVVTAVSGFFVVRDRVPVKKTARGWLGIVWLGFSDAMNVVTFFAAYQRTSVAIAVMTHYLTPIFVAVAAPWVLRERRDPRTVAAVGAAFVGLILLLGPWRGTFRGGDLLGALLGSASAFFYASNVLVNKGLASRFSGSELMFFHGVVAAPVLLLIVPHGAFAHVPAMSWVWLLGGAVGPGALGGLFFIWGLRRVRASHASTLTLLEPLVAVVVGAVALGEALPLISCVGGALILIGGAAVITAPQSAR
jgi:drug/metabolite transporter (DMT)-like permease